MKRNSKGQFRYKPFKRSNWSGLKLLTATTILGASLNWLYTPPQEPLRPIVGKVEAIENKPRVAVTIEEKVKATFGKDGDKAWKIITECENRAVNPKATHYNSNGTWDAGLMQINQVHGYSQEYLFNVDNNLRAAKKIYDRQGFRPWSCAWVIGEKPFYER